MNSRCESPVLLLVFNRPDVTKKLVDALSKVRPKKLYIAADGPRVNKEHEDSNCELTRVLFDDIEWECQINRRFLDVNKGCRRAVSEAISWFFENEEKGIILEDDCIPDPSFFTYCDELLDRYSNDNRVMSISGNNFQFGQNEIKESYYFSIYNHCWGWASWRRAWEKYDSDMKLWPRMKKENRLQDILHSKSARLGWENIFDKVYKEEINSWAYRWTFSAWCQGGLTILPQHNLVSNIGFGEDAEHTKSKSPFLDIPRYALEFPLVHPKYILRNVKADKHTQETMFYPAFYKRVIGTIGNGFKRLRRILVK